MNVWWLIGLLSMIFSTTYNLLVSISCKIKFLVFYRTHSINVSWGNGGCRIPPDLRKIQMSFWRRVNSFRLEPLGPQEIVLQSFGRKQNLLLQWSKGFQRVTFTLWLVTGPNCHQSRTVSSVWVVLPRHCESWVPPPGRVVNHKKNE